MDQRNTGVVQSISRVADDCGRVGIRVIVDFYDGNEPDVNNGTVWNARPVIVIDATTLNAEE